MGQIPQTIDQPSTTDIATAAVTEAQRTLAQVRKMLDPALRAAVARLPESMRALAAYHFGWCDEHGTPVTTPTGVGKAVRPALVLLATEGVGADPVRGLPAAVAMELIHNASLLHDDIIDGDTLRRGRPTLWSVFGTPAAILTGDALSFLAHQTLADAPAPLGTRGPAWLNAAVQQLIDGEYHDTTFETRPTITLAQCHAMTQAKTGALLTCALALGALAGNAHPTQITHLRHFGHHLGIAYQLTDDLLGIWGDPTHTGKPHRSDLRTHKKSLPVVAALTSNTPASHELATLYHHTALTHEQQQHAADLITAAGGRTWATQQAHHHLTTALHHLTTAHLAPGPTTTLTALTHLTTHRNH